MKTIFKIIGIIQFVVFCYTYFPKPSLAPIGLCGIPSIPNPPSEPEFFGCTIRDEMPRFPGCEDLEGSKQEIENCANQKLLNFIYSNIKYPLGDESLPGTVIVQFIVEKDGRISHPKIIRDVVQGFGEEVIRVIKSMPKWVPGKQGGRVVKTRFTLPVKIRLE